MHVESFAAAFGRAIDRGVVVGTTSGALIVALPARDGAESECDVLATPNGRLPCYSAGTTVLVWLGREDERPVVLGCVAPWHASPDPDASSVMDEIVLEARQYLTLKCGDGSITIRADGKILIKGKDLVSHAQRMNRIKGGAVAIN